MLQALDQTAEAIDTWTTWANGRPVPTAVLADAVSLLHDVARQAPPVTTRMARSTGRAGPSFSNPPPRCWSSEDHRLETTSVTISNTPDPTSPSTCERSAHPRARRALDFAGYACDQRCVRDSGMEGAQQTPAVSPLLRDNLDWGPTRWSLSAAELTPPLWLLG